MFSVLNTCEHNLFSKILIGKNMYEQKKKKAEEEAGFSEWTLKNTSSTVMS